nr:hypothetical protein [Tanacetum cinerariifolium]
MSNTDNNLQTQTSNALYNAIMEVGGKDRPPMLAPAEKEINKLMALISLSFKKIYKPTNNKLRTSSNTSRANLDNTQRINKGTRFNNQRAFNVAEAKENVGTQVVQQSGIQCYNCKEYGHVVRECHKPKRTIDEAYHKKKMLLCKQEEAGFQLNAEQADWRDETDDEPDNQELEAHISVHGTDFKDEQHEHNIIIDSLDMSHDREQDDKDDDDLVKECDLIASLIKKLKCKIDDSKNHLKKFQAEHDRYHDVNYASKVEIDYAKAKGDLMSYKMESQKSLREHTRKINDLNQTI